MIDIYSFNPNVTPSDFQPDRRTIAGLRSIALYKRYLKYLRAVDTEGLIDQIYNAPPLAPAIVFDIQDKHDSHGLHTTNKLGGLPDLRKHWLMEYRKDATVKHMVEQIWPRHPQGGYLECLGTVQFTAKHIRFLLDTTNETSVFQSRLMREHLMITPGVAKLLGVAEYLPPQIAFFAPWQPMFDNRLDACMIKMDANNTHGISEDEYLDALDQLGLLRNSYDHFRNEESDHSPLQHYPLTSPKMHFDLDAYHGDWCDHRLVPEPLRDAFDNLCDKIMWDDPKSPWNDTKYQGSKASFGGAPRSQQVERRYFDLDAHVNPVRMTPFVNFLHPEHDMTYQIYMPRRPAMETADSTFYGKLDASCT